MASNKPNEQNNLNEKNQQNQINKNNLGEQNQKDENMCTDDDFMNNNETNLEFIEDMDSQYDHPELMKKPLQSTNPGTGTEENISKKPGPFIITKNYLKKYDNQTKSDKFNNNFEMNNKTITKLIVLNEDNSNNKNINKNKKEKNKTECNKNGNNYKLTSVDSNLPGYIFERVPNNNVSNDEKLSKEEFDKANMQSKIKDELENNEGNFFIIQNLSSTCEQTNNINFI